jgi:hypothetical protein
LRRRAAASHQDIGTTAAHETRRDAAAQHGDDVSASAIQASCQRRCRRESSADNGLRSFTLDGILRELLTTSASCGKFVQRSMTAQQYSRQALLWIFRG